MAWLSAVRFNFCANFRMSCHQDNSDGKIEYPGLWLLARAGCSLSALFGKKSPIWSKVKVLQAYEILSVQLMNKGRGADSRWQSSWQSWVPGTVRHGLFANLLLLLCVVYSPLTAHNRYMAFGAWAQNRFFKKKTTITKSQAVCAVCEIRICASVCEFLNTNRLMTALQCFIDANRNSRTSCNAQMLDL